MESVELIQLMGPSVSTRQELAAFKAVNQVVYRPEGPAYQCVSTPCVNSVQNASFVSLSEELSRKAEEVSTLTQELQQLQQEMRLLNISNNALRVHEHHLDEDIQQRDEELSRVKSWLAKLEAAMSGRTALLRTRQLV